jgi:uncharacterized metal-binding protein YceD (DUF177 family)
MSELPWSHAVTDIPEGGLAGERSADVRERAAVAEALGLVGCHALSTRFRISPLGQGRYRLAGQLKADVEQTCIVSLEPIPAHVDETFDVQFWPKDEVEPSLEGEMEALAAPEIEPIADGLIDFGRIVFEQLAAGLDPFPRKADAVLERHEAGSDSASAKPFAALEALRKKP